MPLLIEDWDKLFSDTMMTVAAIDRLIHHAKILQCKGESYKRKQAQNKHKTSTKQAKLNRTSTGQVNCRWIGQSN